jgi:hypothetical protein
MSGKNTPVPEMVRTIMNRYGITKAVFEECIKRTIESLPNPSNNNNRRNVINAIFKNKLPLHKPEIGNLEVTEIEVGASESDKAETSNAESPTSESDKAETSNAESPTSESDKAETSNAESPTSESDKAETSTSNLEIHDKFTFQITSLVCGQFKGTVQEFIERELANQGSSCGARAFTIASNLVKVAATRIFADPSQSIMELLTNSIDSYRRMNALKSGEPIPPSIGKFGMGFMSILWWVLNKTSDSAFPPKLVIVSTLPGQLPYMAGIYAKDDELWCDYHENVPREELEKSPLPYFHRPRGTSIQLYVSGYTTEVLKLFNVQISKLRYVQDINIKVDPHIQSQTILNGIEVPTNTIVYRESIRGGLRASDGYGIFIVDDFAEGIPKSVFFGSLLAPSLSTKTLTTTSSISLPILPSRIEKYQDYGGIIITVGDIVVVGPRTIGNPDVTHSVLNRFDYIISLPITTSLPVSRDDVILNHGSINYGNFLGEIRKLINIVIASPRENYSLDFFIKSLKKYADYSGQPAAYNLVTDALDYIKSKEDVVLFVPTEILATIVNENFAGHNATVFSGCSLEKIATKISRLCDAKYGNYGKKLIKGIRIIPVSGIKNGLNGGVPSLLFFPFEWMNLPKDELVANIVTTTPRLILEDSKDQDSTLEEMWNGYWESYIPDSFRDFFVYATGILDSGKLLVPLSLRNGIQGDMDQKITRRCAKYKNLHPVATRYEDFAAEAERLYNNMVDVYEKYKDRDLNVMKTNVREAGYELIQYLLENNDEFLSTSLHHGTEFLVDVAIIMKVNLFDIPDKNFSNFVFRQSSDKMTFDQDSSLISQFVLVGISSYNDLLRVFENIIKLSPIRFLLALRYLLARKNARKNISKVYHNLPDVVLKVRDRALDLCKRLEINKIHIFIGSCLLDPEYVAGYRLNHKFERYETLIRTLFSAIFAFANSLSSNHVKIFDNNRSANLGYHTSSSVDSHTILNSVLGALKLLLHRYYASSPSASVVTHFSSSSTDLSTPIAHTKFIEEYINLLIAYFTSLDIDCVYGGKMILVYDYIPIFWPHLVKEFVEPLSSTIGNFNTKDFDNLERRDDLFNNALLQSLYICKFEGRHAIKHFTFVNGILFQDLTIKAMVSLMKPHPSNDDGTFPLQELINLGNQITRKCRTGFEGSLVALVMFRYIYNLKDYSEVDSASRWVDMIFSEVRIKYSIEFMDTWVNYNHTHENRAEYREFYDASFFIPLQNTLRMCMIYASQGPMGHPLISGCKTRSGCKTVTITANQLIDYVFSENSGTKSSITTNSDLLSFLQKVEMWTYHQSRKQQFQMVQIAANEGTSKPFVDSVLTELVQNSVDAIRTLHSSQSNPSYEKDYVNIVITEDAISVGDTVGIPPSAYLSLWIPFLSSKSGSLITTGEMGTGLFNIYRQPWCAYVRIVSNDIEIIATPIIDPLFVPDFNTKSYARVLDIQYQVSIPESNVVEKRGTLVTVNLSDRLSLEQKVSLAMEGSIHTQSQLAFIPSRIDLNGKTITLDVVNLYETEVGRCYYVASGVQYPSVLLTNGVPMGLLAPYLIALYGEMYNPDLANGVVIDLNKKYYNATQSRNRLVSIPRDTDVELNAFIKSATYRCLIRKLFDKGIIEKRFDVLESYLPNSASTGEIEQFRNYSGSGKLAVDGKSFFESPSIPITPNSTLFVNPNTSLADIWHSAKMMLWTLVTGIGGEDKYMGKIDADMLDEWYKNQRTGGRNYKRVGISIEPKDIEIFKRIIQTTEGGYYAASIKYAEIPEASELILNWFLNKYYAPPMRQGPPIKFVTKKTASKKEDDVVISKSTQHHLEEFKKIMGVVAKAYFEVGKKLDVNGLAFSKGVPKINVIPDRGHFSAYYSKKEHAITFAYGSIETKLSEYISSWNEFKNILKTSSVTSATGYIRLKSPLWNVFGGKTPASTLVHEMQHALFSQNHNDGDSHGNHTFMLEGKRYDLPFENACRLVFDTIVTKGFLMKICELAK